MTVSRQSIYELINPDSTKVGKIHFVDYFWGDQLNRFVWGIETGGGAAGTVTMSNSVNGGVDLTTGTSYTNRATMGFAADSTSGNPDNSALVFDSQGAVIQFIMKFTSHASSQPNAMTAGFHCERRGDNAGQNGCAVMLRGDNFKLRTCDNAHNQSESDSGLPNSTRFTNHFFRVEIQPTVASLAIDGVLSSSHTGSLPSKSNNASYTGKTGGLAPCFGLQNGSSGHALSLNVSYVEAWNT